MANKTSEAQLKATRNYESRNPNKTGYDRLRRQALNFVNPTGAKGKGYIESEYGAARYIDDLKDLQLVIKKRVEELKK